MIDELSESWKDDEVIMVYTCEVCGHKSLVIPDVCPQCKNKVVNA